MLRASVKTAHITLALVGFGTTGCGGCSKAETAASDAAALPPLTADAGPMNVTPVPAASIAAAVNPQKLPAYTGPTGSVEGTIFVTGDPAPKTPANFKMCPAGEQIYGHAFRDGTAKAPGEPRWLADAVVAVTGYGNFYVPERQEAKELAIKDCGFSTRTVTMTYGQRLDVKNLTKDFWTPQLQPTQAPVLMMATPGGDPVKLYPKLAGHYLLVDHDRKWAEDDLYAFLHPLHTSSAVGGTYRIDGVPVGKVKVNTSHPRITGEASKEVEIKAGETAHVDLTLDYKTPPPAPPSDAGPPVRLH